jgi:V/A-type H+-transporting ATPase subunit A
MNKVLSINGPILKIAGENFAMAQMVKVNGLPGEVIAVKSGQATVQLYESTAGLTQSAEVQKLDYPMSLELRPGIIGGIFDGIMRPLQSANEKKFTTTVLVKEGQRLKEGEIFAEVAETQAFTYRAMLPPGTSGTVTYAAPGGEYLPHETILTLEMETETEMKTETGKASGTQDFSLSQRWPLRIPRPVRRKLSHNIPLITGIRIIDSLFPLIKGGTCAIPGGFGTGKTSTQHQIAKYCNADIIVYACEIIEPYLHTPIFI